MSARLFLRKTKVFVLLLLTSTSALSQNNFLQIADAIKSWYINIENSAHIGTKKQKSVDFQIYHYSITGYFNNGVLEEGCIAQFYNTSSLEPTLLLEGNVSYQTGRLIIDGIKYEPFSNKRIYGTFYVYNMDDYSMNYKSKKAGSLRIKCTRPVFLVGNYLKCPTIVKIADDATMIYLDGKSGGRNYSFLKAKIPSFSLNKDDSFDLFQLLLSANDEFAMYWENGQVFNGSVKPTLNKDSTIAFLPLQGQKTGMKDDPKAISIRRENGYIVYALEHNDNNQLISKESLYIKDNRELSETDFWMNASKAYEHCDFAKCYYRNGNYFEGKINSIITENSSTGTYNISSTLTSGVFKYLNGDRFEGNLSGKTVGPFFIDGTTHFADWTKETGNWLKNFKLTDRQWSKVKECTTPSEARSMAKKLMKSNLYQRYEYEGVIEFFNPTDERREYTFASDITYNKASSRYTCKYEDSKEVALEFTIDDRGYRKMEIVFTDGKPMFINKFRWYANGTIESIETFSYSTKKIYLSCKFFSDGVLRSAYLHEQGNSGENILRKSKESHPTLGGYTCKLYDLNGNYERSIEWNIGIGESLFGGTFIQRMAPSKIDFNKLKPREID